LEQAKATPDTRSRQLEQAKETPDAYSKHQEVTKKNFFSSYKSTGSVQKNCITMQSPFRLISSPSFHSIQKSSRLYAERE
jgi:hypothetical protein